LHRPRFRVSAGVPAVQRLYRLTRACCAYEEELANLLDGAIECDEATFSGAWREKRGWGAEGKILSWGFCSDMGKLMRLRFRTRNGLLRSVEFPGNNSIFSWGRFVFGSTIVAKNFPLCLLDCYG
jgi:hypothetical protein